MKIIEPSVEIIPQTEGLEGVYKQIELAGRTCYKSDHLIKEGSAKSFVDRMISLGHGAMLEHGTVYLLIIDDVSTVGNSPARELIRRYTANKYSKVNNNGELDFRTYCITTNLRVLYQGDYETWDEAIKNNYDKNWLDNLQYLCEPIEWHEKRVTARFLCQVAISREFNRSRVHSPAEQSTRYCNYGKDKFGNEISINLPTWISEVDGRKADSYDRYSLMTDCEAISTGSDVGIFNAIDYWMFANSACEYSYMKLLELGWKPEQARTVLPLDLNTELVHTAFVSDWEHFFELRCDSHAHPDAQFLANKLRALMLSKELIGVKVDCPWVYSKQQK